MQAFDKEVYNKLKAILPTLYDIYLGDKPTLPCITYIADSNNETIYVNGFRSVNYGYYVKVWANKDDKANLDNKVALVDIALRDLGLHRSISNDIVIGNMILKVLLYEGRYEEY